jgi:hypothetical protein
MTESQNVSPEIKLACELGFQANKLAQKIERLEASLWGNPKQASTKREIARLEKELAKIDDKLEALGVN